MSRAVRTIGIAAGVLLLMVLLAITVQVSQARPNGSQTGAQSGSQGNPQSNPQSNSQKASEQPASAITVTGKLVMSTTTNQKWKVYILQDPAGKALYELELGPKWFYGSGAHPFDKYVGQTVTVTGVAQGAGEDKNHPNNGTGNGHGQGNSQGAKAVGTPHLEVFSINGTQLRGAGKPPWAGGPKSVPNHPGNNGKGHGKGNGGNNGNNGKKNKP